MDHDESLVPCIFYQSLNTYFHVMLLYLYWSSIWLLYRQLDPFSHLVFILMFVNIFFAESSKFQGKACNSFTYNFFLSKLV